MNLEQQNNFNNDIFLGCDVRCDKKHNYFLGSCKEAIKLNATSFMIFTRPNRFLNDGSSTDDMFIYEGYQYLKNNCFEENKIVVHAPYFIEIADISNKNKWLTSREELVKEIKRCDDFRITKLVLHPGKYDKTLGKESGLKGIICALNYAIKNTPTSNVIICLETMASKTNEIGGTFEDLQTIISNVSPRFQHRLGVCFDTCHVSDAGYDLNDYASVFEQFDKIIGIDKIKVFHINDAKFPRGSHMDRHQHIGLGYIGFEILYNLVHDEKIKDVPKILETSQSSDICDTYQKEISMLCTNDFDKDWLISLFKDY